MDLHNLKMKDLVEVYNEMGPEKPAGLKTFKSCKVAIDRIDKLRAANPVPSEGFDSYQDTDDPEIEAEVAAMANEQENAPIVQPKLDGAPSKGDTFMDLTMIDEVAGKRSVIGRAICRLLLQNKESMSHKAILDKVLEAHPGAKTTVGCVSWYASKIRSAGQHLPRSKSVE